MEDGLMGSAIQDSQKNEPQCQASKTQSGNCAFAVRFLLCDGKRKQRKNCPKWNFMMVLCGASDDGATQQIDLAGMRQSKIEKVQVKISEDPGMNRFSWGH